MFTRAVVAGGLMLCVLLTAPARGATTQQIEQALARASEWLYSQQSDGNWERSQTRDMTDKGQNVAGGQWGGTTALVTYALLASGHSPQEPRLQPAIQFLKKADMGGVYALGMRMQVWSFLPQTPEIKALIRKDATALSKLMYWDGKYKGLYDYTDRKTYYSLSRAQYGVLGMWTAAELGIEVPRQYWQNVENAWLNLQKPDGSWQYIERNEYVPTPGITAVGVATLFITQDYLHADKGVACRGNITNPAIEKGLDWMAAHFDKVASDTKYDRDYPYFTLYAVERIGVASGLKHFRGIDWYQKGADWIVKNQSRSGSWSGHYGTTANTAMAILFLSRGRAPVAINKLRYEIDGKEGHWNQRPREVANVTRWIARSLERDLNWQIVNLDMPLADLHEAPILYMAGSQELKLSDEHKAQLKAFIESGGLVVGSADCQARPFQASFRKLAGELFPAYELRELPAEHPIYTGQQFQRNNWRIKPSVLGLSNGVRELMILLPHLDAGRAWQLQQVGGRVEAWQLASNLLLYATDRQPMRKKGETFLVEANSAITPSGELKLARLKYAGNWDPEPGGWRRLAAVLHNEHKLALAVEPAEFEAAGLRQVKVAHLTGTDRFTFDDAQRQVLKTFIDAGSTLVIDAAGGSTAFADSAEELIEQLYPEQLKMLPEDHALFARGGSSSVSYRSHAMRTVGNLRGPRLQGVEQDGRVVVIYSREDLSAGLVGNEVDGIMGYSPVSATDLMTCVLLYADARN